MSCVRPGASFDGRWISAGVGAARATARLPRRPAEGGPFRLPVARCKLAEKDRAAELRELLDHEMTPAPVPSLFAHKGRSVARPNPQRPMKRCILMVTRVSPSPMASAASLKVGIILFAASLLRA
jgi:hypothetical protein